MGFFPRSMERNISANPYAYDELQTKMSPDYTGSVSSETSSDNASVEQGVEESLTTRPNTQTKGTGKRARKLLTQEQSRVLHNLLRQTSFPSTHVREEVAAQLGLSPRKVQVFFQNKRQKQRKKSNMTVPTQAKIAESQRMLQARCAKASPVQQDDADPNILPFSKPQLNEALYDVLPSESLDTNATSPSMKHYHAPQPIPYKGPYPYPESQRAWDRPYWHESRYDGKDVNVSGSLKVRPDLNPSRLTPPYTRELCANQTASQILPPIVSNHRTSTTKLPSIDEVVAWAQY